WLALTELRLPVGGRERHLWPADPVLRRVVQAWEMAPVELERGAVGRRAGALRTLRRMALDGRVVGFFPEGHHGRAGTLGGPLPGVGRFLGWLERSGVALVPAAIYEAQGRLVVRCGPQVRLTGPPSLEGAGGAAAQGGEEAVASRVMEALAALLPAPYRGAWGPGRTAGPASPAGPEGRGDGAGRSASPVGPEGRGGTRVREQTRWRGRGT
ncbi:MAG TPA: hypothetical protein VH257_09180, partial [Chloroflexota bacterium]|nr:hypothetical protein [Chloroflexota bacterium]